jgi:hypothetical protein
VVLINLVELPVPEALATHGAQRGLRPSDGGGVDVLAGVASVLKVGALASLVAAKEYLIDGGALVLRGDVPDAVHVGDLIRMVPVKLLTAKDADGDTGDVLEVAGG